MREILYYAKIYARIRSKSLHRWTHPRGRRPLPLWSRHINMEHTCANKYNRSSSSLSCTLLEFREACLTPQVLPAYSLTGSAVPLNTEQGHQHANARCSCESDATLTVSCHFQQRHSAQMVHRQYLTLYAVDCIWSKTVRGSPELFSI